MTRYLIFLTVFTAACSSYVTYDEALRTAEEQEIKLGKDWYSDHPIFIECIITNILESETVCPDSTGEEGNEVMVVEFNKSGRVVNTFYEGKDKHLKCMAREAVGIVCENPPLPNLFGKLEVNVSYNK